MYVLVAILVQAEDVSTNGGQRQQKPTDEPYERQVIYV